MRSRHSNHNSVAHAGHLGGRHKKAPHLDMENSSFSSVMRLALLGDLSRLKSPSILTFQPWPNQFPIHPRRTPDKGHTSRCVSCLSGGYPLLQPDMSGQCPALSGLSGLCANDPGATKLQKCRPRRSQATARVQGATAPARSTHPLRG